MKRLASSRHSALNNTRKHRGGCGCPFLLPIMLAPVEEGLTFLEQLRERAKMLLPLMPNDKRITFAHTVTS
jgi:hypothetical protein